MYNTQKKTTHTARRHIQQESGVVIKTNTLSNAESSPHNNNQICNITTTKNSTGENVSIYINGKHSTTLEHGLCASIGFAS